MNEILIHRHPQEGHLTIIYAEGVVKLDCRWPIDMDSDEWMCFTDSYDPDIYRDAIRGLVETGNAMIPGERGYLKLNQRRDGMIGLELTLNSITLSRSLFLIVPGCMESLLIEQ